MPRPQIRVSSRFTVVIVQIGQRTPTSSALTQVVPPSIQGARTAMERTRVFDVFPIFDDKNRADASTVFGQGSPSLCSFGINGRFLAQATTGVQRYAREITRALDGLLDQSHRRGTLLTPGHVAPHEPFKAIDVVSGGPFGGHVWEQIALPARWRRPVLNLCNSAPILASRSIVCLHDANVFTRPESYRPAFRAAYRLMLPTIVNRASRVTSVSKAAAQQLAAVLPIAARDIVVLPNGHEHALQWQAAAADLAAQLPLDRPFVLLLGSRARHKNASMIIELAPALNDLGIDLVIAGGGAGIFSPLAETTVGNNIKSLGFVTDDDLAFLYERALCLVFPSWTEGFGLPLVEAMALGCPIVSSNRASMPEVCGPAALLAAPDDPAAWLRHISSLLSSVELRAELRGRGSEQVQLFSWKRSAEGYLELLGSIT